MRHTIFGVHIDDLSSEELTAKLVGYICGDAPHIVVTPNPEFLLGAQKDRSFQKLLSEADLALPDGVGLRFAVAALSDNRLQHRHTGADTLTLVAKLCAEHKKRLLLLGAINNHQEAAAQALRQKFSGLDVVSFDPGIIDSEDPRLSEASLASLERLQPQVVMVALGQGKQEKVMAQLKEKLSSLRLAMGVGGSLDYLAGAARRAPVLLRTYGFEWAWRLLWEPWRRNRIFRAVMIFPCKVAWTALKSGRLLKAVRNVSAELKTHFSKS